MDRHSYFTVSAVIFLIVAVVHGLRVMNGWDAMVGGYAVPVWASYIAAAAGLYLAWTGYNFRK